MTNEEQRISRTFSFLNSTKNKKDLKSSPVFYTPDMMTIVKDIVLSLNKISSAFKISAYKLDYTTNDDKENEMIDVKHKSKDKDVLSMNIDKTIYYKLSLCIVLNEHRIISNSDIEKENLKSANINFVHNLDEEWIKTEKDIGTYVPGNKAQHSCVLVDLRLPEIKDSFIEMKGKMYYLTYSVIRKITLISPDKVHVNRFASNAKIEDSKLRILHPYYYMSVDENDLIWIELGMNKKYNLFDLMAHFDINKAPLMKYKHDIRIKNTLKNHRYDENNRLSITIPEFDKYLIYDATLTLLGYKKPTSFKYYRYGAIIDAISTEIVCNVVTNLPKATGPRGQRYYYAKPEEIVKACEAISATFKPSLFMNVLSAGDHDSIKGTYSEHCVFNPLKVSKDPNRIEMLYFEEDMETVDIFGTSQTKTNILRTKAIPPFIDPEFIG